MSQTVQLKQVLSLMSFIFAKNFADAISADDLEKLPPSWILKTKNPENEKGVNLWQKTIKEKNTQSIKDDFEALKNDFDLSNFGRIDEKKLEDFYSKLNFVKPFKELKATHASNLLAFLGAILKQDDNEQSHTLLGICLSEYCLPSIVLLAKKLQNDAKSDFYKAMGEFVIDYFKYIKEILGLRAEIE